ncbi:hypothetical protein [Cryptosporangium arvum]|uniref:Uncharacterized protein n=1 Tax=Cryptosporangium arvum DSM 44712 TaxID=927661 RepID=A0A010YYQ0_9ACTN|nr:hypothetical protein [Cryptosporangium arvum]EXG80348.1 hypothetical protein CryarDRAFT_1419 [Cryptosporangium arvum DSM 44712]
MRDHVIVKNERRALLAYSSSTQPADGPEFSHFLRGAAAALDWATNTVANAPVGPGSGPADAALIAAEIELCDVLLAGSVSALTPVRKDPHYVNGVEHALRWLLELEAEPPVPLIEDDAPVAVPAA